MKRFLILVALVVLVASSAVPTASGQRPCTERLLRAASVLTYDERSGLQIFVWERCGKRSGVPMG